MNQRAKRTAKTARMTMSTEKSHKEPNLKPSWFSKIFLQGKIYLINPDFQWRFMGYVILTVVFSISIMFISNYLFFESFIAKGEALGLPENHAFFVLIKEQRETMTTIFLFVSVFISFVIGMWGLFFSHRIAGPLYRLRRYFTDATETADSEQKLDPIFFRQNDFFLEVPDSINEYLKKADLLQEARPEVEEDQDEEAA